MAVVYSRAAHSVARPSPIAVSSAKPSSITCPQFSGLRCVEFGSRTESGFDALSQQLQVRAWKVLGYDHVFDWVSYSGSLFLW